MINLSDISLLDLLPPNLQRDPAMAAAAKSLDTELQAITSEIKKLDIFGRSAEWTDEEVDELAWEFRPPYYDPELPIEKRRMLVQTAIPLHRRKGTPKAVEDVLSIIFSRANVVEWFEYGGTPGHFKVSIQEIIDEDVYNKAISAIQSVKNLKSVLDTIETVFEYRSGIKIAGKYSKLSFPFRAFASQTLYAGVPFTGPAVVNIPANPVYVSGEQAACAFERTLQGAFKIAGLIYAGTSGVAIPPTVKPNDEEVTYFSGERVTAGYEKQQQEGYKLTGTIYSGGEPIK
ncbi:phage tail protein, P2 protein I family [Paenibacillus sophorae]|uniref:Phage tail protein I n=1 Tax=Paenibacillus sophorae TaxID=1333845 RepID=A0A1H8VRL6_9BACL|nr:phage tail protein I [Paenibacillus sophorae]QWU15669.1 phage tail protein I [Paenibacillus sophorae]SEP17995.1 phage tail protein, P2 protein I family [Paenibacillus sophorae]